MNKKASIIFKFSLLETTRGFTLTEIVMVGLISSFIVAGIYGVFFRVADTYTEEQRASNIQYEGEWILDLIENGGGHQGKRIIGLKSMNLSSTPNYLKVGDEISGEFDDNDYKIQFQLDEGGANTRYAEFSVDFDGASPTANLYFRLKTTGLAGVEHNYDVLITDKLLMQRYGTDPEEYGSYDGTWFKAERIPSASPYVGIRVSFYLVDYPAATGGSVFRAVRYNYQLDRELDPPIEDEKQRQSFLGAIPYPQYFSRTIYFPNAN